MSDLEKIKIDVKDIDSRANTCWYDIKILARAVLLILEELTADRKTENSSEKPNNCDTCRNKGVEGCEQPCLGCGCCGLYEPKDEPQTDCAWK